MFHILHQMNLSVWTLMASHADLGNSEICLSESPCWHELSLSESPQKRHINVRVIWEIITFTVIIRSQKIHFYHPVSIIFCTTDWSVYIEDKGILNQNELGFRKKSKLPLHYYYLCVTICTKQLIKVNMLLICYLIFPRYSTLRLIIISFWTNVASVEYGERPVTGLYAIETIQFQGRKKGMSWFSCYQEFWENRGNLKYLSWLRKLYSPKFRPITALYDVV